MAKVGTNAVNFAIAEMIGQLLTFTSHPKLGPNGHGDFEEPHHHRYHYQTSPKDTLIILPFHPPTMDLSGDPYLESLTGLILNRIPVRLVIRSARSCK